MWIDRRCTDSALDGLGHVGGGYANANVIRVEAAAAVSLIGR